MNRLIAALALSAALFAAPALAEPAPEPDQPLTDASQEARARKLFAEVRCVVCQHESISDSPAGIAADMRRLVREEIASGASDDQVREGLVRRWGDFILFKPPVNLGTLVLWFGPISLAILGGLILTWRAMARRPTPEAPLSAAEEAKLSELLSAGGLRPDPDASSPHDRREDGTNLDPSPH
jgi:cytochrome c-type biogenesis protein CcmH